MNVRRPALPLRLYSFCVVTIFLGACLAVATSTDAQEISPDAYAGLRWRFLGTHRGGRITTVTGVVGSPNLYYAGTPNGGVWKTDDGGRTWKPIFDSVPVPSIGAMAVAPSNPKIIYVATGEQGKGGGIFKSTDGGETWASAGLADNTLFDGLMVDPKNPDVVIAGASGRGREEPRGLYKTTDGGKTWKKSFAEADVNAGVADVTSAADNPKILYAALYPVSAPPQGEKGAAAEARVLLSQDEGSTWTVAAAAGLPEKGRGRIGVAVVPGTSGQSVLAIMNQGLFRSDDAGATWRKSTDDPRILGSGYFSKVYVDPNRPNVVYVMQTCSYRSNDGGKTFFAFRGAPSGEDHHVIWIAPDHSNRMILGTDQGAIISVNDGATWTDWLNQATGQLYHVTTDNQFPYHAYAAQQDSGTIVVPNRSDYGQITYRDWFSSGGFESGYIAPDPLNANLVYSVGWFGTVLRLDRITGQIATVYVPPSDYKTVWETPLVYSPRDPHSLYYGAQYLLKTTDGAVTWSVVSPDLGNSPQHPAEVKKPGGGGHEPDPDDQDPAAEADKDAAQFARTGAIHTIAPSPREDGMIWVGTSNGLIQLFRANTWQDVTPPDLPKGSDVAIVEASTHDANTAFAVIKVRRDDHPYVFRTHDAGKTWTKIVTGLPEGVPADGVREDVKRKGLLFAGTERAAYVSFDDGSHWQTLQLNLPASPVTDFAVHGDDLVASTFGRGLWVLDDITPLRELSAKAALSPVHFFKPQTALRIRWDNHEETPLSPEFPASANPPDGAILDYFLKTSPRSEISLDLLDAKGNRIRHYSSSAPIASPLVGNAANVWFAPPTVLQATPGLHRFIWDLHAEDPLTLTYGYFGGKLDYIEYTLPDHSIPGQTPRQQPPGPLVPPGTYFAVLKVDGKEFRQPLEVDLDPRVHASGSDLDEQWNLAASIASAMAASYTTYNDYAALQSAIDERMAALAGKDQAKELVEALDRLHKSALALGEGSDEKAGIGPANRDLARFLTMVESADLKPAASARKAATNSCAGLRENLHAWQKLNAEEVPNTNQLLQNAGLAVLPVAPTRPEPPCLP